jgi:hypothetical protein
MSEPELKFGQTRIMISLTGKVAKKWPFDDIDSIVTLKSKTIGSLANYLKLPFEDTSNPQIALQVINHLNNINIHNESYEIIDYLVKLYDDGYFVFSLKLFVPALTKVKDINRYINDILMKKTLIVFEGKDIDFTELSKKIVKDIMQELKCLDNVDDIKIFETYSIMNPTSISPDNFNLKKVIGSGNKQECDLYEATIRRMSLSGVRIDLTREEQKNVSLYDEDMVFLNYHNLFAYIANNASNLQYEVYEIMMDLYKIYIAKLKCILKDVNDYLKEIGDNISEDLKELEKESAWIETMRRRQLQACEQFREPLEVTSTRLIWFKSSADNKFLIKNLNSRLADSLDIFEKTISRRVLLKQNESIEKQNETIQKVSISLIILSIVIAIVAIIVGLFINSNKDPKDIQSQCDKAIQAESIDSSSSELDTVIEGLD